ncbi:hypothetical protein D9M68_665390 [compost metagenome]
MPEPTPERGYAGVPAWPSCSARAPRRLGQWCPGWRCRGRSGRWPPPCPAGTARHRRSAGDRSATVARPPGRPCRTEFDQQRYPSLAGLPAERPSYSRCPGIRRSTPGAGWRQRLPPPTCQGRSRRTSPPGPAGRADAPERVRSSWRAGRRWSRAPLSIHSLLTP